MERPVDCYCDEDQGAGYTYSSEHGSCKPCERAGYCQFCKGEGGVAEYGCTWCGKRKK